MGSLVWDFEDRSPTFKTGRKMKTALTCFTFAFIILVTEEGMGCVPSNIFNSEWRFNLYGPEIAESKSKEGLRYQKLEKDFKNHEEKIAMEPSESSRMDITRKIQIQRIDRS